MPSTSSRLQIQDWQLDMLHADIAFGPVYFCAAYSGSSTLCKTAIAELTQVTLINALSQNPIALGYVNGLSGTIKSATYNFGMSWFDTQTTPVANTELGHSMILEATAQKSNKHIHIIAKVDVLPQHQGQMAITSAAVQADVHNSKTVLQISFDAAQLFSQLDLDALYDQTVHNEPILIDSNTLSYDSILLAAKVISPPVFNWVEK